MTQLTSRKLKDFDVPYLLKTRDPTTSDDGYAVPTYWINTTTNIAFLLTDNTVGAAKWVGPGTDAIVFRQQFTGDGSIKTFTLSGTANATFDYGSWQTAQVLTTYPAHVTKTNKKALYDSANVFTRNRISVSSINAAGLVTLDYIPIADEVFYIWYWYQLTTSDGLSAYYREDFTASMEEEGGSGIGVGISLDTANFDGILTGADSDVQTAIETIDDHLHDSRYIRDIVDVIKDTHVDWGTGENQVSAVDLPIADAGSFYTATEAEAGLQEIAKIGEMENGSTLREISLTIASAGGIITASLSSLVGNTISFKFSTGITDVDVTVPKTATLTAGTDTVPVTNYLYVLASDPTTLVNSDTSFPTAVEYFACGKVICQSAASIQDDGCLKEHIFKDAIADVTGGHDSHISDWIRDQWGTWISGVAPTFSGSGTGTIGYASTAGVVKQLHPETFPQFTDGADIYCVNDPDTAYRKITNIGDLLKDSAGNSLTGKTYALVFWGALNDNGQSKIFVNLPSGSHNKEASARQDKDRETNYSIPTDFKGVGFLIYRLIIKNNADTTWTLYTGGTGDDLRGQFPATSAGSSTAFGIDFPDGASGFTLFNSADVTKQVQVDLSGITTGNTRTVTFPDSDITLIDAGHNHDAVYQPLDSTLTAFADLLTAAGKIPYAIDVDTGGELDLVTTVGDPGSDTNLVSEQGIREALVAVGGHAVLDGTIHTDSVAKAVTRGSIIYGNATPKWDELVKGAADTFLGSGADDISWRTSAQVMASLSGSAGAAFNFNSQALTGVASVTLPNAGWTGIASDAERLEFYEAGYAALMGCNLGIGTASPVTGLEVANTSGSSIITITSAVGSDAAITLKEGTNNRWTIRNDGDDGDKFQIYKYAATAGVAFTIDSAANIGFRTTDIEAWSATYGAIEFPESAIMYEKTGNSLVLFSNAYYDGAYKFKAAGKAARAQVYDGEFSVLVSNETGSENGAISWTTAMTIDNAGNTTFGAGVKTDNAFLKVKVVEIGTWNMDTTPSVNVLHGLTFGKIRGAQVVIRHDGAANIYPLGHGEAGSKDGYWTASATEINLYRETNGAFDAIAFDTMGDDGNRGWIIITYEA